MHRGTTQPFAELPLHLMNCSSVRITHFIIQNFQVLFC